MKIGNKVFDTDNEKYIMGILNVTPDSFSDGGRYNHLEAALNHAGQMIAQGASIIDVGGESTRPGFERICDEEEIARAVPVIEALKKNFDVPVSVDTYKSKVAEACLKAGADFVNDIWGFRFDKEMAFVVARYNVPCCLMHNRSEKTYGSFVEEVLADLRESVRIAREAGVRDGNILLDPGVGFGKDYAQNLTIIKSVERLRELGYPVLLGTSRKSVIGLTLDVSPENRCAGTVATTVYGALHGCSFFRVHDVLENRQALDMIQAIMKG